jgi:aminoglycoside phosphotransferase (APT) family kinase protein
MSEQGMSESARPADMTLQRSSRDQAWVQSRLAEWLGTSEVVLHEGVETNGMSSETVLLAVDGSEYVARVAPSAEDLPVFQNYNLQAQ